MDEESPVSTFLKKLLAFLENAGYDPVKGSPADDEIRLFPRPESIRTAFSQAAQMLIAATDYLEALDTLVRMERFAVAPWSCARGVMESATVCTWLLEPGIGPKERVSRSLSLRYATLRAQEKMARYDNDNKKIQDIRERLETIEKTAIDLGFEILRDRNNKRTGIGQIKPSMTTLMEKQFKCENLYRTFSGMAHSDYSSLTAFSFMMVDVKGSKGALLLRAVPTTIQSAIIKLAVTLYAKCVWLQIVQFGFDAARIAILLEELYNKLELADTNTERFWRMLIQRSS
ncbi:MAG: hypothetical protein ABSH06_24875 [Thermodesulfobacteriota bacterium]|jgi:hypothetical protein